MSISFMQSSPKKFGILGINKSYHCSSNFVHYSHFYSNQLIVDRLPKDFHLIAGDSKFSINKTIISSLSPLIQLNIGKDKNYDTYIFKKESAFPVFPLFCNLLKGEEVVFEKESLILLRKLLKELQINFSSRSFFSLSVRSRRNNIAQNLLPKDDRYSVSYCYDFFKNFEKEFTIKTRNYSYKCFIPYVYVSDLLYRKIKEIEEQNQNLNSENDEMYSYFYDVDDEESQYRKVFSIFSGFFSISSDEDYKLLLKVAVDFEISFLPQLIQEMTERKEFVEKKFLEYDYSQSEELMNRLFTFDEKDVDEMLGFLKNSKWMSDNDHLKELAYCVSYVASIRLNRIPPLCELSSRLGNPFLNFLHYILYHQNNDYSKFASPFRYMHQPSNTFIFNFCNELYERKILIPKSKFLQLAKIPIFVYKYKDKMRHSYKSFNKYNHTQLIDFQFNNNEDIFKRIIYLDDVDALKSNFDIQIFSPKSSKLDTNYFSFSIICGSIKCFNFLKSLNIYDVGIPELSLAVRSGKDEIAQSIFNDPSFDLEYQDSSFNLSRIFISQHRLFGTNNQLISCSKNDEKETKKETKNNNDQNMPKEKKSLFEVQSDSIISSHNRKLYDQKYIETHPECLIKAIKCNNFEVVRMCKHMIADLNYASILEDLVTKGFIDMFFFILSMQPNPEKALFDLNSKSFDDNPGLINFAVATGNVRLTRYLHEHLSIPDFKSKTSSSDCKLEKLVFFDYDLMFSIAIENFDLDMIKFIILECNYKPSCDVLGNAIKTTFWPGQTAFVEFFYKEKLIRKDWLPAILEILATGGTDSSFETLKEVSFEIQKEMERIKAENESKKENDDKNKNDIDNENENKNTNNNESQNENEKNNKNEDENKNDNENDNKNDNDNDNKNDNENENNNNNDTEDDYKYMIKNIDSAFERAFIIAITYGRKSNVEFLSKFNLDDINFYRLNNVIQYGVKCGHLRSLCTYLQTIHNEEKRRCLVKTGLRQAFEIGRHQAVKFFLLFDPKILDDQKIIIELMINGYSNSLINEILRERNQKPNLDSQSDQANKEIIIIESSNDQNNDSTDEYKEIDFMQKIDLSKLDFSEIDKYITEAILHKNRNNEEIFRFLISKGLFNPNKYLENALSFPNYKAFKILLECSTPRYPITASALNYSFYALCDNSTSQTDNDNSNENKNKESLKIEKLITDKSNEISVTEPYGLIKNIFSKQYNDDTSFGQNLFHFEEYISKKKMKKLKNSNSRLYVLKEDSNLKKIFLNSDVDEDEIISLLINFEGIDVNFSYKSTPLIISATLNQKTKIVKALANHPDIDINATDKDALTAIMHAARLGNREIFDILYYNPKIDLNKVTYINRSVLSFAVLGLPEVVPLILSNDNRKRNENCILFDADKSHTEVAAAAAFSKNDLNLFSMILKCKFDVNRRFSIRSKNYFLESTHSNSSKRKNFRPWSHERAMDNEIQQKKKISERNLLEVISIFGQSYSVPFLKLLVNHPNFVENGSNTDSVNNNNDDDEMLPVLPSDIVDAAIMKAAENPYQNADIMMHLLHIGGHDVNYSIEKTPLIVFAAYNNNTSLVKRIINSPEYDVGLYKLRDKPIVYKPRKKSDKYKNILLGISIENCSNENNNNNENPNNQKENENNNNQKESENKSDQKENENNNNQKESENKNNQKESENKNNQKENENKSDQKENENNNNQRESENKNNQKESENKNNQKENENKSDQKENENDLLKKKVPSFNHDIYFSPQTHAAFCMALFMGNCSVAQLLIDLVDVNDYAPSGIRYPYSSHRIENGDNDYRYASSSFIQDDSLDLFDFQLFDDYGEDDYDSFFDDSFINNRKPKHCFDSKLRVSKLSEVNGIQGIIGIDTSNINSITKIISSDNNIINGRGLSINLGGKTPLTLSLFSGNDSAYRILMKREELDINKPNKDGSLPVFYAAKIPSLIHEISMSDSFDINVADSKGETMIMKILKADDLHNAWIYLKKDNIDLLKVDNRGNSVRSILEKKGVDTSELGENPSNDEMLAFLKKYVDRNDFKY